MSFRRPRRGQDMICRGEEKVNIQRFDQGKVIYLTNPYWQFDKNFKQIILSNKWNENYAPPKEGLIYRFVAVPYWQLDENSQ